MQNDELIANLRTLRRRLFKPRVKQSYDLNIAPPASEEILLETENRLGFAIPPLLRRIYMEIGNGGFGPGYGLIGALEGRVDDRGNTIVEAYQGRSGADPNDPFWIWPEKLVPLFSWGGAVYSCGDFSIIDCPMHYFDPQLYLPNSPLSNALRSHGMTLSVFLSRWISGDEVMRM